MSGLYLHIPFCKQACHYCDFHFSTSSKLRPAVIEAMCSEIAARSGEVSSDIQTIYLGGGTPSILNQGELRLLFDALESHYDCDKVEEITIECNPDDIHQSSLDAWKNIGINRLSVGIQSFDDQALSFMNRAHSAEEAVSSMHLAREAGFDNITLDLIYGIPNMSEQTWKDNISKALSLHPQHISAYCLTIEPNTVFGKWWEKGKLTPVSEEVAASQFEIMREMFHEAGFEPYEVSNFARAGFESKHNSAYWQGSHYLGFGPSAHSFDGPRRRWNVANNAKYVKAIAEGNPYWEEEELSVADQCNERIMTRLRTTWGLNLGALKDDLGIDLMFREKAAIQGLINSRLATLQNEILRLTFEGILQADRIASDLFIIEE